MQRTATSFSSSQQPVFNRASPKLPNPAQLAYLMDYIANNTNESEPLRDQNFQNFKNLKTKPQETKNLQKFQNPSADFQNTSHDLQNPSLKIQNFTTNIENTSSPPNLTASNNFINSLNIRKKSLPFKFRFKSAPNMQKFDFRQVSSNYQLRIINKKVLVSARMRASRKIRKFNFVLPETCDTRTFTHRLDKGVLEFKWKEAKKESMDN